LKVALVARDIAPSEALGKHLAPELQKRGHEVVAYLGSGKPLTQTLEEIRQGVRNADVLVSGMSSSKELAEPEITACLTAALQELSKKKIPFGFYGDTYHCYERARENAWFGPVREDADFFFSVNEEEAMAAKSVLTNPNLISIATGNPTWEGYAFPKYTRAEVRAKYGIADEEVLILAPGGGSPAVNTLIWGLLIDALACIDKKSRVMISYHPDDRTQEAVDPKVVAKLIKEGKDVISALADPSAQLNIYGDLKKFSSVPVEFLPNDVKTSDVLPGADIVVEWGSSIAIEAAHQRIPVASVSTEIGRRMFSFSKTEKWEPVELLGVAWEAEADLYSIIGNMFDLLENRHGFLDALRARQSEVYPKLQEKGAAVKKMADVLEQIAQPATAK